MLNSHPHRNRTIILFSCAPKLHCMLYKFLLPWLVIHSCREGIYTNTNYILWNRKGHSFATSSNVAFLLLVSNPTTIPGPRSHHQHISSICSSSCYKNQVKWNDRTTITIISFLPTCTHLNWGWSARMRVIISQHWRIVLVHNNNLVIVAVLKSTATSSWTHHSTQWHRADRWIAQEGWFQRKICGKTEEKDQKSLVLIFNVIIILIIDALFVVNV